MIYAHPFWPCALQDLNNLQVWDVNTPEIWVPAQDIQPYLKDLRSGKAVTIPVKVTPCDKQV